MVHSLPSLSQSASPQPPVSGRWKMLAIMLVCSLPVLASYFAYYVVRPQGRAGIGELIVPASPVPNQVASTLDGGARALSTLRGHWLLVTVAGGRCALDCPRRLFLQRQLREMLGKGKERVDRVWLVSDQAAVDPARQQGLLDTVVLRVDAATLEHWLPVPSGHDLSEYLFVVDPQGNAMMRLPSQFDSAGAAKARHDLERLLSASVVWNASGI